MEIIIFIIALALFIGLAVAAIYCAERLLRNLGIESKLLFFVTAMILLANPLLILLGYLLTEDKPNKKEP
jgi:hypothetical protein